MSKLSLRAGLSVAVAIALFGSMTFVGPAVASTATGRVSISFGSSLDSDSNAPIDVADENTYTLSFAESDGAGSFDRLQDAAAAVGAELRTVVFEGEAGVGQLIVIKGDTAKTITDRAAELFAEASTGIPPMVGGLVVAERPVPDEVVVDGTSLTLSSDSNMDITTRPLAAIALPPAGGARYSNWDGYKAIKGWPGYNQGNDWDAYFPFWYRTEGWNLNRCTQLVNQVCQATTPRAALRQSINWIGGSHTAYWPDENNWGFEFGSAMYNYTLCGSVSSPTYSPGWWLNPTYAEWATNVPIEAQPYQDVNREFDECQTMTHELGIRYPTRLTAGYEYIYYVSSPRNAYRPNSTYSASFQAVHNDCPPGTARDWLTHCMGPNELINFPYGRQSATVINASNYFASPGCARMYSGWAHPIQWFNGEYKEMPVPMGAPWENPSLSFFDGCASNDWY